jgi:CubicO group peptidase (beta-lactamase class C family)
MPNEYRSSNLDEKMMEAQVDEIFSKFKSNNPDDIIPGGVVMVVKDGKPILTRGYGVNDIHQPNLNSSTTNFRLASVSKQFTAMGIMLLIRDGKLRYDDFLVDIFPGFSGYGRTITIHQMLDHTSGMLDYEEFMESYPPSYPEDDTSDSFTQISDLGVLQILQGLNRTKFPPGSRWEYSNSAYVVLGLIIEKLSNMTFHEFLDAKIFKPLGMTNTIAYIRGTLPEGYHQEIKNRAFGHSWKEKGEKGNNYWVRNDQSTTSATIGDGGIYSSLEDLLKWDKALTNNSILSAEDMAPALTPVNVPGVIEPDGKPAAYGFGWFLNDYRGQKRMWHYGETSGFRTTIQRFPDMNLSILILCNREDVIPAELALQIADLYIN